MEQNKNAVSLVDLKCEYAKEPLGIDAESPRLSWKICSDQNNTRQTSYRIIAIRMMHCCGTAVLSTVPNNVYVMQVKP